MTPAAFAVDGSYDFNRVQSTESTEPATGVPPSKITTATAAKTSAKTSAKTATAAKTAAKTATDNSAGNYFSFASSSQEIDCRGVPISPKKMPPTPPRDLGSPYNGNPRYNYYTNQGRDNNGSAATAAAAAAASIVKQPFLSSPPRTPRTGSSGYPLFLRPSTTQNATTTGNNNSGLLLSPPWQSRNIFRSAPQALQAGSLSREEDGFYTIQRSSAFDDESDEEDVEDRDSGRMAEF